MKAFIIFGLRIAGTILFAGESFKQKAKQHFVYCEYSSTIRLMPQNYLVAVSHTEDGCNFLADPDAAIKDDLASKIFVTLRKHRFQRNVDITITDLNKLLCKS